MSAPDAFVPLAVWLAGPTLAPEHADPPLAEPPAEPTPTPPPSAPAAVAPLEEPEVLRDVRLFRARLADALALATTTLLHDLAYAVLGRELLAAPADVAALAARILAEHPAAEPVLIRHAAGEAIDLGVPTAADSSLAPGDLLLTFADGVVDARLGVRLAVVLEARA